MALELVWLGHSAFSIAGNVAGRDLALLVDPFLDENPAAPCKSDAVSADTILLTHGHFDHVGDVVKITRRTGATVVANFEICQWLGKQGVTKAEPMNIGGGVTMPLGRVQMTIAHHSSTLPDGTPGGTAGGFLLTIAGQKLYFAGDTALFDDMRRIGAGGLDLAVLPIGDRFTMGPDDSLEAIRLLNPKHVVPCHYNTWPPIAQDAQAWAERVRSQTKAIPHVFAPGGKLTL